MSLEEFAKRGVAAQKAVDEITGPRPVQLELTREEYEQLLMKLGWAHGMMIQMAFPDEALAEHLRLVNRVLGQGGGTLYEAPRPEVKNVIHKRETLSVRESVRITGFGITQTYKLLKSGVIPSIRVGKQFFIPRAALMRWLESSGTEKFD